MKKYIKYFKWVVLIMSTNESKQFKMKIHGIKVIRVISTNLKYSGFLWVYINGHIFDLFN